MARTREQWEQRPSLPLTHYVDTRLYTDATLFAEEREKIFGHTWSIACHESELEQPGDYRTFQHPAGPNLVLIRGKDAQVRAFFNICPHEPGGDAAAIVSALQVFQTRLDGGTTSLLAVGRIHDQARWVAGSARLVSRRIRLDTRDLGIGTHIPL